MTPDLCSCLVPSRIPARLLLFVKSESRLGNTRCVAFHISHRFGGTDANPSLDDLPAVLEEVAENPADAEHVGVAVVHESGWCVGVHLGWTVVFENVDDLDVLPRHLDAGEDRDFDLRLMRAAARGDLTTLEAQHWAAGHGTACS